MSSSVNTGSGLAAAEPPPPMETLTCFGRLPLELQDYIWEVAAEMYVMIPRRHQFEINCPQNTDFRTDSYGAFLPGSFNTAEELEYEKKRESYTCMKVFYNKLEDDLYFGLVHACNRSRRIFYRTISKYDPYDPRFDPSVGIVMVEDNSFLRFTFVYVHRDMIVVYLNNLELSSGSAIQDFMNSAMWGGCTPKHIGVLYRIEWLESEYTLRDHWIYRCEWTDLSLGTSSELSGYTRELLQLNWAKQLDCLWLLDDPGSLIPWPGTQYSQLTESRQVFPENGYSLVQVFAKNVYFWPDLAAFVINHRRSSKDGHSQFMALWELRGTGNFNFLAWKRALNFKFKLWLKHIRAQQPSGPQPNLLLPVKFATEVLMDF